MNVSNDIKRYDVAVLGVWYGLNYGSLLTYYALRKQIVDAGKSVVMVKHLPDNTPISVQDEMDQTAHNNRFISKQGYETYTVNSKDARSVNELADTFVIGSDQVWNYHIAKLHDDFFYMADIDTDKRKIANAVSLGHAVDFAPDEKRPAIANLMNRFNAISVREFSGVGLLHDKYGVHAEWSADPLLTIDANDILQLAKDANIQEPENDYLLAYILDPSLDKINGIKALSKKLGLDVRVIVDGFKHNRESNIGKLGSLSDKVQDDVGVEEFVKLFSDSSYVVTDSFHGAVMSIKMEKEFAVATERNMRRGMTRLESLFKLTGLGARHTYDANALASKQRFVTPIDYTKVNNLVARASRLSNLWLTTALDIPVDVKVGFSPLDISEKELSDILLKKKSWSFGLWGKKPYSTEVRFLESGEILGVNSEKESSWELDNGRLLIRDQQGEVSHTFFMKSIDYGKPMLLSDTSFDHSLVHFLN